MIGTHHSKYTNANDNAKTEASVSGTQRPNSAPASPCGHNLCRQGSGCQCTHASKTPSRNFSGTQTADKRSSGSLAASRSFETPFGVVWQTSSSTMEPVGMHSGTSQESFRREMSLYRLHTMPALTEDANSSDEDDELTPKMKSHDSTRIKRTKTGNSKDKKVLDNKSCHANTDRSTGCTRFLKSCFSCTKTSSSDTVDAGKLLDVQV